MGIIINSTIIVYIVLGGVTDWPHPATYNPNHGSLIE